jgi:hypothetical protein
MRETAPAPRPRPFGAFREDLKLALRLPLKDRGYAGTALATLAVAVGAAVAVASVYHSVSGASGRAPPSSRRAPRWRP